jgi:hypothetical protein
MQPDIIRIRFIEKFGLAKYIEFVLSLYESFPRRNTLFYWQENLIKELSTGFSIEINGLDELYKIFCYCPIHNIELLNEDVPVVDGNEPQESNYNSLYPLANINAPRDLDRLKYPQWIDIFYCPKCRAVRLNELGLS